jgi:hypothetical protein
MRRSSPIYAQQQPCADRPDNLIEMLDDDDLDANVRCEP